MQINQGFAASGRGYVRAVFSRRMRGYALPLDLVRVHLRASNSAGMARRLRAAFAGYLVSDDEAGYPFRNSRELYRPKDMSVLRTGFAYVDGFGGDLDAPQWIAAGAMVCFGGTGWFPDAVRRGEA